MTEESELGVLLHVSVSDVVPQNDHAGRALNARRGRVVRRRLSVLTATAVTAAASILAVQAVEHRNTTRTEAAMRWQRPMTLDGGRFRVQPAAADDVMPVTEAEVRALLHRSLPGATVTVVATRWGRVTVTGQDGKPVNGLKDTVAWAAVFRVDDQGSTCPGVRKSDVSRIDPGDYAETQVLVVTADGARALYSQAGSWLCGLPIQPVAKIPEAGA